MTPRFVGHNVSRESFSNADPQNETDSSYSESDEEKEYKIPTKD